MSWEIGILIYLIAGFLTCLFLGLANKEDLHDDDFLVALVLGLLWPLLWTFMLIAIIIAVSIGLRLLFRQVYKTIQDKKRTESDNPVDPAEIEPLPLKGNGAEI